MTPEDKQHFEDMIVKAIQSTKQENSGLVDTIMHKLESTLEPLIDRYVNGKINKLLAMQEAQNKVLETLQTQIKTITNETKPLVDGKITLTNLGKATMWIGGFVIMIATILKLIK